METNDLEGACRTFLAQDVDYTELGLEKFLSAYMSVREPVMTARATLNKELLTAREKLRVPKDKELTDFDRRTMNEAYCAEVQEKYEIMKGLDELLKEKMELVKMIGEL